MLETVSEFCFYLVEVHLHTCISTNTIDSNFLLFSFVAIVIVLLQESIVPDLVRVKVASTDLSMKIQFSKHVSKLNRVIH